VPKKISLYCVTFVALCSLVCLHVTIGRYRPWFGSTWSSLALHTRIEVDLTYSITKLKRKNLLLHSSKYNTTGTILLPHTVSCGM